MRLGRCRVTVGDAHFSRYREIRAARVDTEAATPPALASDHAFEFAAPNRDLDAGDASHLTVAALDARDLSHDEAFTLDVLVSRRVGPDVDLARLREHARERTHDDVVAQLAVAADDDFLDLVGGRVKLEPDESSDVLPVLTNVGTKQQFHWAPPSTSTNDYVPYTGKAGRAPEPSVIPVTGIGDGGNGRGASVLTLHDDEPEPWPRPCIESGAEASAVKLIGILLIVFGIVALAVGSIGYTKREKVLDIGPIQATQEKREMIPLPPIAGIAAVGAGVVLVV